MEDKPEKPRTSTQNAALHLAFRQIADELNDHGLTIQKTLRADIEVPWSPALVKEILWRSVQKAMFGKQSTTSLSTKEIDQIFEVIAKHLAEKGLVIYFPSVETLIDQQRARLGK